MRPATIPYTNTPRNGNPNLYLVEMAKTDPIIQRTNTTKSIFNDIGIGFQPVSFPILNNYYSKYLIFTILCF